MESPKRKSRSTLNAFSRAASYYHEHATVQQEIAKNFQKQFLEISPLPTRVLDVGCGTGFLTQGISESFCGAEIIGLDLSPAMLEEAAFRFQGEGSRKGRVEWISGDILEYQVKKPFSLIVSSSSLQWVRPYEKLFSKLKALLLPDGTLAFSMMIAGTLIELQEVRRHCVPAKATRSLLPESGEIEAALFSAGFEILEAKEETFLGVYPSSKNFFEEIHRLGITGGDLIAGNVPLSREELKKITEFYQRRYAGADGRVTASYKTLFMRAVL